MIGLMPSAVVPAAGSASRFGGGKLLVPIGGAPLLDRTIGALLDGGLEDVVVVVPPEAAWTGIVRLLDDPRVRTEVNHDPSRGMFSSIQIGMRSAGSSPVLVLPGDMPFVSADTVERVLEAAVRTGGIVSPRLDGRRGHPVAVPGDLRDAVLGAPFQTALNQVLRPFAARFVDIDVEDKGVVRDVDVRSDLSADREVADAPLASAKTPGATS
jgi:CTP:molybdopterin cytidylyltransferase MocA